MLDMINITPPRVNIVWDAERIDTLTRLFLEGKTFTEIGNEMGVSRCAIAGKVYRHGMDGRAPYRERRTPTPRVPRAPRQPKSTEPRSRLSRPPTVIKPDVTPMAFLDLSLFDLTDQTCRYPHGEGPYTFCGQQTRTIAVCIGSTLTERQSPYCDHHHELCHQPPLTAEARLQRDA